MLGYGEATAHHAMAAPTTCSSPVPPCGRAAFARAGLSPRRRGRAEVYDSFTITAAAPLEALGFCAARARRGLLADGRIRPGGALPLNTAGGGLSYCHPGQYGVLLLVEAIRQLRGECGEPARSPAPRSRVAHGTGGDPVHARDGPAGGGPMSCIPPRCRPRPT